MYRKHPFYFALLSARSPDFFSYEHSSLYSLCSNTASITWRQQSAMNSFYRTAAALTSIPLTACGCTLLLIMRTTRISPGTLPLSSFISFLWTAEPVFKTFLRQQAEMPCTKERYWPEQLTVCSYPSCNTRSPAAVSGRHACPNLLRNTASVHYWADNCCRTGAKKIPSSWYEPMRREWFISRKPTHCQHLLFD